MKLGYTTKLKMNWLDFYTIMFVSFNVKFAIFMMEILVKFVEEIDLGHVTVLRNFILMIWHQINANVINLYVKIIPKILCF